MPKLFLKCSFLTRSLRRKYFQGEINSTEAYSGPDHTSKIILTKKNIV